MTFDPTIRHLSMALAIAACAMLALAAPSSACSEPSPGRDADHPGPVVLRMETVGGFAPLPVLLLRVPTFTLYEDGLTIFQSPNGPLMHVELDDEQADRLIEFASHEGGLADARPEYFVGGIADATTTVFTLAVDGREKRVSVYALGIHDRGPDRAAYRAFERLATMLADFGSWLPDDAVDEPYQPAAYRGIFAAEDPERPDLVAWPWDDLAPDDLQTVEEAPFFKTAVLTPDQVAVLAPIPSGEDTIAFVATPDGAAYRLMIRPMLPDELPATEAEDQA